ncbi:MAG: efflux RND transporter periplasmic adaptor subunit [Sandarakinorhabdus sp.]|nr:efflux RND transporter periplasmic adaptor subunit [Sandarakinorhabdus sp.]
MRGFRFGRHGLPALALFGLLFAAWVVVTGRPDRSMTEAPLSPPRVPAGQLSGGTVSGAGIVEPSSELVQLSPLVPGVVTKVTVVAGDRVEAGKLLITLDDRDVRAAMAEAGAMRLHADRAVDAARVTVVNARRQLDLLLNVSDPAAVAEQQRLDRRQQLEGAEAEMALAQADRARADAAIAAARTEIARREVRAPRAGEILQVRTRPGQFVTAGPGLSGSEPPITMGETQPLHVRIDVDETEIGRVAPGADAVVSARGLADRQVRARFVRVEPLVVPKRSLTNQSSERVDVRVLQLIYALPEGTAGFLVGQQVDAFLPARSSAAGGSNSGATVR